MLLNYNETLVLVEKFMKESGIRDYCSTFCKGNCCQTCYEKGKHSCRVTGERKLPCSIFVCDLHDLQKVNSEFAMIYKLKTITESLLGKVNKDNIYFGPISDKAKDSFVIGDSLLRKLNTKKSITSVKGFMNKIVERAQYIIDRNSSEAPLARYNLRIGSMHNIIERTRANQAI